MTSVGPPPGGGPASTVRRTVAVPALGSAAVDPAAGLPQGSTASSFAVRRRGSGGRPGGVRSRRLEHGPLCVPDRVPVVLRRRIHHGGEHHDPRAVRPRGPRGGGQRLVPDQQRGDHPSGVSGTGGRPGPAGGGERGGLRPERGRHRHRGHRPIGGLVSSEFQQIVARRRRGTGTPPGLAGAVDGMAVCPDHHPARAAPSTSTWPIPVASAVTATVSVGLSSASVVPRRVVIPPLSIVDVRRFGDRPGCPSRSPTRSPSPRRRPSWSAGRCSPPSGSPAPQWGSSSGTVTTATRWLVPGPGIPHVPGTDRCRGDRAWPSPIPGPSAARVAVTTLGGDRTVAVFTVAPDQVTVLGPKLVGGLSPLSVVSSAAGQRRRGRHALGRARGGLVDRVPAGRRRLTGRRRARGRSPHRYRPTL